MLQKFSSIFGILFTVLSPGRVTMIGPVELEIFLILQLL